MANIPIGLQLYSIRKECEKDLPGSLAAVKKAGYVGIEYAGYYGRSAKELLDLQNSIGLKCCGTHTPLDSLLGDELKKTIEFNKTLGNKFLIVPWLSEERRNSKAAWVETAKLFSELAAKAKPQGMLVGYHNHHVEFPPMEGAIPWDVFYENSSQDVLLQMDTGNALHGGGDPVPFLQRHKGRSVSVHLKEYSKTNDKALIGEGDVRWKEVFAACESVGKTEWYIVEQESYAYPPLECVARCLDKLRQMGKA
jgi:sugar phosphate isomerase/epimerase